MTRCGERASLRTTRVVGPAFLQWFIVEQVEEEAMMGKLVDLPESGKNLFQAQQYLPQVVAAVPSTVQARKHPVFCFLVFEKDE